MAEKLIVQACYLCETIIFGRSSVTVRNGWYVHARCDRDFPERGRHTKMAPFPTTFPKYVLDQDSPLPAENRVVEPSNFTHRPYASVKRVTMGRTVFYRHPGSADGTFAPRSSPAMVQEVLDEETGKCRLFIFGPKGQHLDEIEYGDGPCQWSWPPII